MFEQQFQFSTFEVVYPPQLDAGNLKAKYDVIIFMEGIPGTTAEPARPQEATQPSNLPPEWADKVGTVTVAKTIPQLKKFVEDGGTIIAVGSGTNIAYHLDLPVADQLVERTASGAEQALPSEKYFVPGSIVTASVDTTNPLAYGMSDKVDLLFSRSPVFKLRADAVAKGTKVVAWYASDKPVRSGWGWGQSYLAGGLAAVETSLGKGKVFLFGPQVTFRAEPHGSFPLFFNGIYYGAAESANVAQAGRAAR
jgi:hypothetical protein